jgi:uncharacterized protein (UPF0276 family)
VTPDAGERPLGVGFPLHADAAFLDLTAPIAEAADYVEIAPETTWVWRPRDGAPGGDLVRNGYHARFAARLAASKQPAVAHGVGYSLGTPLAGDEARTAAWLARLRDDHGVFRFPWLSDHLGFAIAAGWWSQLPLPLPYTAEAVEVVAARLARLRDVAGPDVPVAFENNVGYFALGDPRAEPSFLNAILARADARLVLDLHNVWTQCRNFGTDPEAYVDGLDLERVIELHVSGGADSPPEWLASRRSLRLDSHDGWVPEPVWALLARTLPRCTRVRGLTLERMNGTVTAADVPRLHDELARAKEAWRCSPTCKPR